jgi:hypothetical protein
MVLGENVIPTDCLLPSNKEKDQLSTAHLQVNITLDSRMILNYELENRLKEVVVAYFNKSFFPFHRGTEYNQSQSDNQPPSLASNPAPSKCEAKFNNSAATAI